MKTNVAMTVIVPSNNDSLSLSLQLGFWREQGQSILERRLGLLLDALDEHLTRGDIVNQADDLTRRPDLYSTESVFYSFFVYNQ